MRRHVQAAKFMVYIEEVTAEFQKYMRRNLATMMVKMSPILDMVGVAHARVRVLQRVPGAGRRLQVGAERHARATQ